MTPESILEKHFGLPAFRAGQRDVIDALLAGRSALAVFPTGGGKSLCYQLPALMLDGLTLVVSPLIALMKDQVDALRARGIAAARLDSTLSAGEAQEIYRGMSEGSLRLLYVAPERLANERFLSRLRGLKSIPLMAIDEAHCISEWGHNFRPDYLKLAELAKEIGATRVLALTATATPKVAADIRQAFAIDPADHVQTGFRRKNLKLRVIPAPAAKRDALLVERLRAAPPGPAIVYVTLQHTAESVAGMLQRSGIRARAYHAGMRDEDRAAAQEAFMAGEAPVIVATIAFGMGIDKADIRAIFHYNLPKSLENYVQEIGRAGRDGGDSVCEMLACADDRAALENFTYGDTPTEQSIRAMLDRLLHLGERFDISRYELSATHDIRPLVVATVLTYLELRGILRSEGPFYDTYKIQLLRPEHQILAGYDAARQEFLRRVLASASKGRAWLTLPLTETAAQLGEPRDRLVRAIGYLEEMGDLRVQPAGLRHAYRLVCPPENPRALAAEISDSFATGEQRDIGRLGLVIDYASHGGCQTAYLLNYFGEEMPDPCGECTGCQEGKARQIPASPRRVIQTAELATIQNLLKERHAPLKRPRQLARFLTGITSPAATRARLNRHDAFGMLEGVPFNEVMTAVGEMVS
ncbi:MAG: ATP-dependent DNA helicase RecQ [Verrucomicrobiales bacterium]